jgi:hypothetical protein
MTKKTVKTDKKTTKTKPKKTRDSRTSYEVKRLNQIFANIDKEKKDLCKKLIENAAFMSVSLLVCFKKLLSMCNIYAFLRLVDA